MPASGEWAHWFAEDRSSSGIRNLPSASSAAARGYLPHARRRPGAGDSARQGGGPKISAHTRVTYSPADREGGMCLFVAGAGLGHLSPTLAYRLIETVALP